MHDSSRRISKLHFGTIKVGKVNMMLISPAIPQLNHLSDPLVSPQDLGKNNQAAGAI
jgi:hypothetical protein